MCIPFIKKKSWELDERTVEFICQNFYPRTKQFQRYSMIIWKIEFNHKIAIGEVFLHHSRRKINDDSATSHNARTTQLILRHALLFIRFWIRTHVDLNAPARFQWQLRRFIVESLEILDLSFDSLRDRSAGRSTRSFWWRISRYSWDTN